MRRMLDVDISVKIRRGRPNLWWKDAPKREYGIAGAERGQHNKQGSMDEEDKQLYRRLRMAREARDEEVE